MLLTKLLAMIFHVFLQLFATMSDLIMEDPEFTAAEDKRAGSDLLGPGASIMT